MIDLLNERFERIAKDLEFIQKNSLTVTKVMTIIGDNFETAEIPDDTYARIEHALAKGLRDG